jgi:sortase A
MRRLITGFTMFERWLLFIGVTCFAAYDAALLHRSVGSSVALAAFDETERENRGTDKASRDGVDFSLWSEKRINAYIESLGLFKGPQMGVLTVARLKIRAPIFEGTDEMVLNRGVGWIERTARLGEDGNIGIAGHRDGFFRALKDIHTGDTIELSSSNGTYRYTVDTIKIVDPENVGVLAPRSIASVTLVTCYPFFFVGSAPQRFIVHAALKTDIPAGSP